MMGTSIVAAAIGLPVCVLAFAAFWFLVVAPLREAAFYRAQGLQGTPWRFLLGDIPTMRKLRETAPEPFLDTARYFAAALGPVGFAWFGPQLRLRLFDAALLREVLVTHSYKFPKSSLARDVFGPFIGLNSSKKGREPRFTFHLYQRLSGSAAN